MIRQLRPFYTEEELDRVYASAYDHTRWPDHIVRVNVTIHVARYMRDLIGAKSGADFSAGDGAILRACELETALFADRKVGTGAFREGETWQVRDIESGRSWHPGKQTDLFICSETLEHVQRPQLLLGRIRHYAKALVLSTPVGEEGDGNPEHYWGWDTDDIDGQLRIAGWHPDYLTILQPMVPGGYVYQIWGCTRAE